MIMINIGGRQMECSVATRPSDSMFGGRESKAVTIASNYADAVSLFVDGVLWSITSDVTEADGSIRQVTTDMSAYAISGPITDNRNGTVTVRMGKYREEELMLIPLAAAPATRSEAVELRGIIEKAVQSIADDADALKAKALYPAWAELAIAETEAVKGRRFRHDGKLYKVRSSHTFGSGWIPGVGTESLYECIDESHSGDAGDPIPYSGNMSLTAGLYYSQDSTVYLCTRNTDAPVYNALSDLVGLYVEAVS